MWFLWIYIADNGHFLEESNKQYLFNELEKESYIEYPTIIYYLNKSGIEKLYKDKLFNIPKIYSLNDKKNDLDDFLIYASKWIKT